MYPCKRCLEKNWRFQFDDATRTITATCKHCEAEASFPARKQKGSRPPRYYSDRQQDAYRQQDPGDDGRVPW